MLGAARGNERLPWGLAWRLALGQIVAWGVLYYAFTVVAGPLHEETGWSRAFINGGLSLGLLAWGICAFPVGSWIQRHGARGVMTWSVVLGAAALALMGVARTQPLYVLSWILLGGAMAGTLYDSAFAAVTQAFGEEYRRGIVLITLVAGFASTVFVPLAQLAVDELGWRNGLLALSAVLLVVCTPLHALGIPSGAPPSAAQAATSVRDFRHWLRQLRADLSDTRFVGLAIWFSGHAAAATGLVFLIVPLLQSGGVPNAHIVQAIAVLGPMQVFGRFALTRYGGTFSALAVGKWATLTIVASVALLLVLPWTLPCLVAFAALFGLGNGVLTIVRGTSVAEFFGTARYAELNGALSAPAVLSKAGAPLLLGVVWSAFPERTSIVVGVVFVLALTSAAGWLVARQAAKSHARATPPGEIGAAA